MSDNAKISADHLRRLALVYVRQSSAAQVAYNRESTEPNRNTVWPREQSSSVGSAGK
jgi:hypothetical protein